MVMVSYISLQKFQNFNLSKEYISILEMFERILQLDALFTTLFNLISQTTNESITSICLGELLSLNIHFNLIVC